MQTKMKRKDIQSSKEMHNAAFRSGTTSHRGIPNTVRLYMMDVQERPQAQIPEAEKEADRLSASVTEGSMESVKAVMGRRMGADFSGVRFHTDAVATAKADAMGARAYTSGANVYFGKAGFEPSVAAHELVHTVQQGMVDSSVNTMSMPAGGVQMVPRETIEQMQQRAREGDRGNLVMLSGIPGFLSELQVSKAGELADRITQANVPHKSEGKYAADEIKTFVEQLHLQKKEMLDPVLRSALHSAPISSLDEAVTGNEHIQNQNHQGLSPEIRELRDAIEDEMNHQIIADSMKLVDTALVTNQGEQSFTNDDKKLAEQAGRNLAHIMLAMQLGQIQINKGNGNTEAYGAGMAYNPSMASLISYGSRVILDFGETYRGITANDVYRSMMELDKDANANGIAHRVKTRRLWATHYLSGSNELVETDGIKAAFQALRSGYKHRGFNPAIGGAGQVGIRSDANAPERSRTTDGTGHIIKPDGVNGHVYLGIRSSDSNQHGGMLVGLETAASGQTNLLGQPHNASATKNPFSPVGADKDGLIGKKLGGRMVKLTALHMNEQVEIHHMLARRLSDLLERIESTSDGNAMNEYNEIMYKLSGSKMSPAELAALLAPSAGSGYISRLEDVINWGQTGSRPRGQNSSVQLSAGEQQ